MQLFAISLPPTPLPQENFDRLLALLPEDSQARIQRFRLPEDALRSLIGRLSPLWFLRQTQLISPEQDPVFERKGKGKPQLVDPLLSPPLAFNDSHDGSYVLLGTARGESAEIGVDLMQLSANPVVVEEGISDQLVASERQVLAVPLDDRDRARRITTFWTFKEGYTKAIGEGIGFGLERIRVDMDDRAGIEKVSVDGRDVKEDGWSWKSGWLEEDDGYGWVVYWKGDEAEEAQEGVQLVKWEDFVKCFDDQRQ